MTRASLTVLAAVFLSSGCGTYSMLRSADTLPEGRVELNAGIAANAFGEVIPVGQAAIGVHDRVELLAQWELWNAFAEARVGLLNSERDGIGLTVGVGGGAGSTALEETTDELLDIENDAVMTGSIAIGKRWDWFELTLGNRTMWLVPNFWVNSTRVGLRFNAGPHFRFIIEGGATVHHGAFAVGEGTVGIGTGW